jgi:transketolase
VAVDPQKSVRQQFADTMVDVGRHDDRLIVMVGDISHGIMKPFREAFPQRYYNVGILESAIISMAAGLSAVGFRPVAHTIAPFILERAYEQIKLDFCYQGLPGNLVTVGSAFDYSNLGCTHHCYGDFAMLKTLQNTEITFPSTPVEFDSLFKQAYANDKLTVYRIPSASHGVDFIPSDIRLGKAVRVREGRNITIIATGPQLKSALQSVSGLQAKGWDPEVVYVHTIRPLDKDLIRESVRKTGRVLTVEEHMESGGLGDDVLRATRDLSDVMWTGIAVPDTFVTGYGTYAEHCAALGLSAEGIVRRVFEAFGDRPLQGQHHA